MRFTIRHHTRYRYSRPVRLGPQQLRFHPRNDAAQRVIDFRLAITPTPTGHNDHLDLEGNRVSQVWFIGETDHLDIEVSMQVDTLRQNAWNFILKPEATAVPVGYPHDLHLASAYLERPAPDDAVNAFAAGLSRSVAHDTLGFLDALVRRIHADFSHVLRETGAPQSPAETLQRRRGACRDLTVLFVDCCRAEGIAARFASGYQWGRPRQDRRHLHAWPEVYLPGAGWSAYDPTHGKAITDTHVTIAAAASPHNTLPVSGGFSGDATSTLDYTVEIQAGQSRSEHDTVS